MSKIKAIFLQHIFPGFYAAYINKIVSHAYNKQINFEVDLSNILPDEGSFSNDNKATSFFSEYIEQIKVDLKEQHDRKKLIEDKAKSLLFIITVSITAITFSLNYLNALEINVYQIIALAILGLSIIYFVFGTIRALQTLNIRQFNVVQVEVEETETAYKLLAKKSEEDFLKELIKSKKLNDLINTRLANYTYASFNLIRNGIILFVIFFITTVCVSYIIKNGKTNNMYPINKEIKVKINDSVDVKIPYTFELKYDLQNLETDKKE